MQSLFKKINNKINGMVVHFVLSGVIMVMAAVLIVWSDFFLRLVIGLLVLTIAYMFFYLAYKVWWLKKEVDKFLRF